MDKSDDLKKAYESDPEVYELLNLAKGVEGLARYAGTHAAAVVIAEDTVRQARLDLLMAAGQFP